MLENSDPAAVPAADTRVSTHELTEALASIDARKTREAFARVGTVTLAEGLRDSEFEATPEELYAEIGTLRVADAVQESVRRRQRRLSLILKAELISALLCFVALFGFQQTLYNPAWQQTQQVIKTTADQTQEFKRLFALTQGTHPDYIISAMSPFPDSRRDSEVAFPRYWLPDGCTVYEDISDSNMNLPPNFGLPERIEFVSADTAPRWNRVSTVTYNGTVYRRGWVKKRDISRMLNGKGFQFYLAPVLAHPEENEALVPVTIAKDSLSEMHPLTGFMTDGTDLFDVPPGSPVHLDSHAWEQSQAPPGGI